MTDREPFLGWHHVDITRDDEGRINVYIDGEWIFEQMIDYGEDSDVIFFKACCEGPALDNVVVRDGVIGIQSPGE